MPRPFDKASLGRCASKTLIGRCSKSTAARSRSASRSPFKRSLNGHLIILDSNHLGLFAAVTAKKGFDPLALFAQEGKSTGELNRGFGSVLVGGMSTWEGVFIAVN